jgi:hypothetical protein
MKMGLPDLTRVKLCCDSEEQAAKQSPSTKPRTKRQVIFLEEREAERGKTQKVKEQTMPDIQATNAKRTAENCRFLAFDLDGERVIAPLADRAGLSNCSTARFALFCALFSVFLH